MRDPLPPALDPAAPLVAASPTPADAPHLPPEAGGLTSRTFLGLLVAQFLAAFNDQAIHAAAMFFAINTQTLTERDAISLMPILFYAPWAIFCTVAGYLADRYSKRDALVVWKVAEVGDHAPSPCSGSGWAAAAGRRPARGSCWRPCS